MSTPGIPEELVTFVQVLTEDEDLRAWFDSFVDVPEWRRADEFRTLAMKMHAGGEHPDMIRATALLAETEIYRAVCAVLSEQKR